MELLVFGYCLPHGIQKLQSTRETFRNKEEILGITFQNFHQTLHPKKFNPLGLTGHIIYTTALEIFLFLELRLAGTSSILQK